MAVRTFRLRNAKGTVLNVTEVQKAGFLHSVGGLGFETDTEYQRVGNFYNILSDNIAQGSIKGIVYFGSDTPQADYQNLVNFLQVKPIIMEYSPYKQPNEVYYRQGTVTELTYDESNPLSAELTFTPTTLPYKKLNQITHPEVIGGNGKYYNYTYNYYYRQQVGNTVTINLDSDMPSGIKLTFYGYLSNPVWEHYINGVLVASGKLLGSIPEGSILIVDTTKVPYSIEIEDLETGIITDVYNLSDFSTERFFTLRQGENTIIISDENNKETTIGAEANLYYASV